MIWRGKLLEEAVDRIDAINIKQKPMDGHSMYRGECMLQKGCKVVNCLKPFRPRIASQF